jgi:ABC-2 type transport system permease protein
MAETIAAPWSLGVLGLFYLLIVAVLAGLWATAADAAGGEIVGYSSVALFWYIAIAEAGVNALPIRMIEEVGDDIGSEAVAVELLRPASVLWVRVAMHLGGSVVRLAVCVVVGAVLALAVAGAPPRPSGLVLAVPSLLLAVAVNSVAQYAFAGAAFWVRDAKGTWFLYQKLVFVLGGMLLPLEVLPGPLETAAKLSPFMAMAYAPARLAAGFVEPWLFAVQLFWLAVGAFVAHRVYAAGERRLVGAP